MALEGNSRNAVNAKVNILLVDDEARNLDVLESTLESEGYILVRALTAERALLALIDGEFAAIVLDVQMPEMSGFELANLIKQRKRTQHIPILFLTAYFQEDKHILEGYGTGAVDYLTKPINPQILKSKIAVFVDLFRKSRELSATNRALEQEVGRRRSAEQALQLANNELEMRVRERTADLVRLNNDLREREREVAQARDRAVAASRAKDDFFARLSHELRTPLNPVLLIASDGCNNPDLPPQVRADFRVIQENLELEARLIDDLLDLTRLSNGKLTLELRPLELSPVLLHAISMVKPEIDQKGIHLKTLLGDEKRLIVGDDVRMKQIFWNVLRNAVKFTPAGGMVKVEDEICADNRHVIVRVTDTGIGMTEEEITRAFEAFSQGDHALGGRNPEFGGIGLGLAIASMLAGLQGGVIRAISGGRGKGSTFCIELPLYVPLEPTEKTDLPSLSKIPAPCALPSRHRRILLVEDHHATSKTLTQLLIRRDYEVLNAATIAEARALAASESFDVLISDIGLPDGSGCELMSELALRGDVIGIAMTGYGMEDDIARSRLAGFLRHLTKPINIQELDHALQSLQTAGSRTRVS